MPKVFDRNNVILLRIDEADLNSFLIDMDIGDDGASRYMLEEFAKVVMEVIPEYVFANYENDEINNLNAVGKLREAAHSIYKIKEFELMRRYYMNGDLQAKQELDKSAYKNRGEFGELILHLLLRDFKGTIPLLVDLEQHFKKEYLDEQFIIIKKNLECNNIPQRQQWIEELSNCNKLSDKLDMINIPMLCTYENDIYSKFENLNGQDAINYHEVNIRELKKIFDDENEHPLKSRLNVILLLFPVKNKKELIKILHEKLWHMQNI